MQPHTQSSNAAFTDEAEAFYGHSSPVVKVALALLAVILVSPTVAVWAGSPKNGYHNPDDSARAHSVLEKYGIQDDEIIFITADGIDSRDESVIGTVNFLDPLDTIYLEEFEGEFGSDEIQFTQTVLHEYAHILQKRILWEGTSSYLQLIPKVVEANTTLADHSPRIDNSYGFFEGYEANADCVVNVYMNPRSYYIGDSTCGFIGLAAAQTIVSGEHPTSDKISENQTKLEDETIAALLDYLEATHSEDSEYWLNLDKSRANILNLINANLES